MKEFEINMVVADEKNKYSLDQINEMFIEWAESKDLICGGTVSKL